MAKKLCLLINSMGGYFICIYIHVYVYIYIYIYMCVCVCVCVSSVAHCVQLFAPHEPQHARPPCPSPTPRGYPNSCPLSQWCHPAISSSVVPFTSCPVFPRIRVFPNDSVLHIRWPKYWSFCFNISPPNEHPRLISFRMDWLDLLAVQGTLKSLL